MYNNCNDDFEKIKKKIDEENKKCKNVIYKDQQDQRVIKVFKVKEEFRGLQL